MEFAYLKILSANFNFTLTNPVYSLVNLVLILEDVANLVWCDKKDSLYDSLFYEESKIPNMA